MNYNAVVTLSVCRFVIVTGHFVGSIFSEVVCEVFIQLVTGDGPLKLKAILQCNKMKSLLNKKFDTNT